MHIYYLKIKVNTNIKIRTGKLGYFEFPAGIYLYTGSGGRNPEKRVERHLKKDKKKFWHIDYLLADSDANVTGYRIFNTTYRSECSLNKMLEKHLKGRHIVKKFGASDCKEGCLSHLLYLAKM